MIYHPDDVTVIKAQDGNIVGYQVPPPSEDHRIPPPDTVPQLLQSIFYFETDK